MENYEIVIGFKKEMHPDLTSPERQIKQCPLMLLSIAMDLNMELPFYISQPQKLKKGLAKWLF